MFLWITLALLMIQWVLTIWSLVPLPFLNPTWTSGSSWLMCYWSLAWRILSITLLVCEMTAIVWQSELSWGLLFFGNGMEMKTGKLEMKTFFGTEMKTDRFDSCGHCWVFQICQHNECSTFTASSFRTWNSSTEISSPPLALFVVMLSKAHLTSHSRMSRWVITPSWLYGSWSSFLYSSVYSCHLFLISSACVGPYHFHPLLSPSLHEIFPWYL